MKLTLMTCDVGRPVDSVAAYAQAIIDDVKQAWADGADWVLLPEFSWMGIERFLSSGITNLTDVARSFEYEVLPLLKSELLSNAHSAVMGTTPFLEGGELRNRAVVLCNGGVSYQDKLHLTPWESAFSSGQELRIFDVQGWRVAVLICLDSEIPELSVLLRNQEVDLLLIPSATENELGVERIARCASARSVELGCYVAVAHLVGTMQSQLVDENVGRLSYYLPSQSHFKQHIRIQESLQFSCGQHRLDIELQRELLIRMRARRVETNPSLLMMSQTKIIDEKHPRI